MTAANAAAEARKAHGRSRVTNTDGALPGVDGRTLIARRFRDICAAIAADQGGAGRLSESRQQLIRRFSAACVLAEQLEAKLANGEQIDIGAHALLTSSMVRVAQRIGINRTARTIVPTLSQYLESKSAEAEVE